MRKVCVGQRVVVAETRPGCRRPGLVGCFRGDAGTVVAAYHRGKRLRCLVEFDNGLIFRDGPADVPAEWLRLAAREVA
jgi:hypothetical protein